LLTSSEHFLAPQLRRPVRTKSQRIFSFPTTPYTPLNLPSCGILRPSVKTSRSPPSFLPRSAWFQTRTTFVPSVPHGHSSSDILRCLPHIRWSWPPLILRGVPFASHFVSFSALIISLPLLFFLVDYFPFRIHVSSPKRCTPGSPARHSVLRSFFFFSFSM